MPKRTTQIQFCIGLNTGDIIVEGKNLYGNGVKLVARHEAISQSGAVFLSKAIHDSASQKVECTFTDLGNKK